MTGIRKVKMPNVMFTRKAVGMLLIVAASVFIALLIQAQQLLRDVENMKAKEEAGVRHLSRMTRAMADEVAYNDEEEVKMTCDELSQRLQMSVDTFNSIAMEMIQENEYVPVVVVDEKGAIVNSRNLPKEDSLMTSAEKEELLREIKALGRDSVVVYLGGESNQTMFFGESMLTKRLQYLTVLQVLLIVMFVLLVYLTLTRARRRERDTLWKGLALETAHQLGTPISALGAWRDVLQTGLITSTEEVATEMTYDIDRLQSVAERFSKIGSTPDMSTTPIDDDLQYVYNYLRSRLSKSVTLGLDIAAPGLPVRHEPTLIRWAVENICKNAADAISGTGSITVRQSADEKNVIVDIIDTGKGMDNQTRKHIFDAGYTTKTRGWGIGLALVKRIITEYHKGKVYVAASKIGEGTTFRIELPRR